MAINNGIKQDRVSVFANLQHAPPGGPFALAAEYQHDENPNKVDLVIGAYRDDNGQPWQLPSVKEAKRRMNIESIDHEYLPLRGNTDFLDAARTLVFGPTISQNTVRSIASIQTVSGTGANSLIAAFLQRHAQPTNIWLPDPTWANHVDIWRENAPDVNVRWYPYYDGYNRRFNLDGTIKALRTEAQEHDAILLHACAHNPTGLDPNREGWREIAVLCEEKKLFIVFDLAYQGFASGDLDRDAWAIRHFATHPDVEMAVCQSFSKNLGLYGERTGALHVMALIESPSPSADSIENHLVDLQRALVSMAPRLGSQIATEVLTSSELHAMWRDDLLTMSGRIKAMRQALYDELVRLKTPGDWSHIVEQTGMFSYTGLGSDDVAMLKKKYHVYMLPSGRASICGLTTGNVRYTAQAIHEVVTRGRVENDR
ncbi:Aspartate aminotransferase [Aspergillus mulundensis]|uniref:aspartate transaminase n=1 Tax=Aspergillus mulundensis TaxID=1810919 RepID=A0A3D8RXY2_9EURO|nr:Aspartate aminotransferase [Aspergillus mulundensis]RDW78912.1 Aspartate aminotransferase [Aspergillus mulundensis]